MIFIFICFSKAGQLAKDLELFAQHAGRKSVTMEDVILSGKSSDYWIVDVISMIPRSTFFEHKRS